MRLYILSALYAFISYKERAITYIDYRVWHNKNNPVCCTWKQCSLSWVSLRKNKLTPNFLYKHLLIITEWNSVVPTRVSWMCEYFIKSVTDGPFLQARTFTFVVILSNKATYGCATNVIIWTKVLIFIYFQPKQINRQAVVLIDYHSVWKDLWSL
jgi:hypothetical protein